MTEKSQTKNRTVKQASIFLLVLLVARAITDIFHRQGWIQNPTIVAVLGWLPFVLAVPVIVLLFVIIRSWDTTTRHGPRIKVLAWVYFALLLAGGFAVWFGLIDWLNSQGRAVARIVYATSSLVPLAIIVWMAVLSIKDLEERRQRDVEAKLHDYTKESSQTGTSGVIEHQPH